MALALAGYRNRMVRMNVTISIATLSLCFGTTVAGFYGMNVVNGFEDSTTAFSTIVTCSSLAGIAVGAGSMNYLSGRTMQGTFIVYCLVIFVLFGWFCRYFLAGIT